MYLEREIVAQFEETFGFRIYPEVDIRVADGVIINEMPSWYKETLTSEEATEVRGYRTQLDTGQIHPTQVNRVRQEVNEREAKIDAVRNGKPELTDKQVDAVKKIYDELSADIKRSLFTYSDMQRGTAPAHEEAKRMQDKVVKISHRPSALWVKTACGNAKVEDRDGSFWSSRNSMVKGWKIAGKLLGKPTNEETLRKQR